jgi:hypothetical protein
MDLYPNFAQGIGPDSGGRVTSTGMMVMFPPINACARCALGKRQISKMRYERWTAFPSDFHWSAKSASALILSAKTPAAVSTPSVHLPKPILGSYIMAAESTKSGDNVDLSKLKTPTACIADFCLIPIGTPTASVSTEIAEVQRLLKKSGLSYSLHSAGSTVVGLMRQCLTLARG